MAIHLLFFINPGEDMFQTLHLLLEMCYRFAHSRERQKNFLWITTDQYRLLNIDKKKLENCMCLPLYEHFPLFLISLEHGFVRQ